MKKISNVLKIIGNIVFIMTMVVCLIFSIFTVPRLFGVKPFAVVSGSMEPTIPTGSTVFVNTNEKDVKEGDIITYGLAVGENKSVMVTHRAYRISDDLIQTKGDNNNNADGWIESSAVVGKYMFHIPYSGIVLDALQEYGFVLIAIWIFVINLILMMLPRILDLLVARTSNE